MDITVSISLFGGLPPAISIVLEQRGAVVAKFPKATEEIYRKALMSVKRYIVAVL